MITRTVISSTDEFEELHDEWDALLTSSVSDCVFLTHEWLFTWWKHLSDGRDLSITAVRDNGTLIGILPLSMRGAQYTRMMPRVGEFVGSGIIGSDYLDAIVQKGREKEVLGEFAQEVDSWRVMLQLSQVRAHNCVASSVLQVLAQHQWI